MKLKYLQSPTYIPIRYIPHFDDERTFQVTEEIKVSLSDGYVLTIEKGFLTDLSSIPKWAWSFFSPMDKGLLADIIHDKLWADKQKQLEYFNYNIYKSRKFADDERNKWRKKLASRKQFKNWFTHKVIRLLGGFFYSKQLEIPV